MAQNWISYPNPPKGEEVVICGISGAFPKCDSLEELKHNLYNGIDMISDDNTATHPDIPKRNGRLKPHCLSEFDNRFFNIPDEQINSMDPNNRILMEKTYEAIIDAGLNPDDLRGTKTGVYTASSSSEADSDWFFAPANVDGYGVIGNSKAMLANRISQWLDLKGPSYNVDTACSSYLYAFEHAYRDLRAGIVECAIVGTANLCLSESTTLHFARLGMLSKDGACRVFDDKATGYVRAEAIGCTILMRAKDAKRIYSYVVHSKNNCDGYKPQGITFPSQQGQFKLMNDFYNDITILPKDVAYVECHGTGTKVGDVEESITIEKIFCKDRKSPLKIGSVKSNLGHSEPSSGLCAVAKCILSMESGLIPPNLHYSTPRKEIKALFDKKFEVIDKITPLDGDYIAVCGYGFGGANSHLLLKRFKKIKSNNGCPLDDIPRLVCVSGRTQDAVNTIIQGLQKRCLDEEYVRLYHEVYRKNIKNLDFRGYVILQKVEPRKISHVTKFIKNVTSPTICYVFSGVGSQWAGMGVRLMEIPKFAATMYKLNKYLDPLCLNIIQIITDTNSKIFDNQLYATLGTTAIQIGLVDVLKEIGIKADHLMGHFVGALACAYADNCLTAEQTILAAYYRGLTLFDSKLTKESKAAFDLNKDEFINRYSTVTKEVTTEPSIKDQGFRNELRKLIPNPKTKSNQWNSKNEQLNLNNKSDDMCTADYLANMVQTPTNLKENFKNIKPNTIILEISPDNSLADLIKDVVNKENIFVGSLMRRNDNNLSTFLNTIGSLFIKGFNPQLAKLYPEIQFPVSCGTPMISPSVKWDHTRKWPVPKEGYSFQEKSFEKSLLIDVNDSKYKNLTGHIVDGRNLYPATGYLALVWDVLAGNEGHFVEHIAVEFEDVQFLRATNIPKSNSIELTVLIQKCSGNFEILESDSVVVTGRIKRIPNKPNKLLQLPEVKPIINETDKLPLSTRDIYKELRLRGYNYQDDFKGIISTDNNCCVGQIEWKSANWIPFMDNMLQLQILQQDERFLYVPTSVRKVTIYPQEHYDSVQDHEEGKQSITVTNYKEYGVLQGGGIQIEGLMATSINRRKPLGEAVLEKQEFIPFFSSVTQVYNVVDAMRIFFQLGLENQPNIKVKVVEVDNKVNDILTPVIFEVLSDLPLLQPDITVLSNQSFELPNNCQVSDKPLESESKADYIVTHDLINNPDKLSDVSKVLKDVNSFVISRENYKTQTCEIRGYNILCELFTENEKLLLLRKQKLNITKPEIIRITNDIEFPWIEKLQEAVKSKIPTILYSQNEPISGLIGLINCLRKEYVSNTIQAVLIIDQNAPEFDINKEFYKKQLDLGLAVNVYKNGVWGGYRHLKLLETKTMTDTAYINCITRGDLSSMSWIELPLSAKPKTIIEICYSAMNFRDVMTATGKLGIDFIARANNDPDCVLPPDCVQGLEFSGIGPDGKQYMGLVARAAHATRVECDENLTWPVPDNWTLEDAATVPVVYSTVYASLVKHGMSKGHSVLIHSGTGGVGLAAIHVALHYGCEVFTTVGSQEKRDYIKKLFPQIKESHIGNSRDTSFEQMVLLETKGRGVDFVLNSLAEEKLLASVRCLAEYGKFMEIGKFDLSKNTKLGMEIFMRGASFHGIMLDNAMYGTVEEKQKIKSMVWKAIQDGAIKPLPRTVFEMENLEAPFRYLSAGKHIGKVLIKIREDETQKSVILPAIPRLYVKQYKSVVIIGGLGGFGLELAHFLIQRGCKNLILSSRHGLIKGYQSIRIQKWRSAGINVHISTANISTKQGCTEILKFANQFGPVDGIYNLAVVLRDALFENQTIENFQTSFGGKVLGTKYLDEVSRTLCPELRHFVVFSSVSCGRGNAGQTNYGMANSVMERICEERQASGYPALAIQWGAIGEVGLVADMQENDAILEIGGTLQQNLNSCFDAMDILLEQKSPVVASMVVAEKKYGFNAGGNILESVVSIMGIRDYTTVSKHANLAEIGMDSMMAVEIKQTLEREFEIFLTPQDIRNLTFSKLAEIQAERIEKQESDSTTVDTSNSKESFFKMFIHTLGDENQDTEPMVILPSIENNLKSLPLFFIPGIEGQSTVFESVCSRLNHRCYGLQIAFSDTTDNVAKIALNMTVHIKSKLAKNEEVGIVAYSYGTLLAREICYHLEKAGHKARCLFIDGSPTFIKTAIAELFLLTNDIPANVLESRLIVMILSLFITENLENILNELQDLPDWKHRVELLVSKIPESRSLYSEKYMRTVSYSFLARFQSIINYKISEDIKLNAPIALARPSKKVISNISEDYDLSALKDKKSSQIPVTVLDGDHYTIIENPSLPDLIKEFFS